MEGQPGRLTKAENLEDTLKNSMKKEYQLLGSQQNQLFYQITKGEEWKMRFWNMGLSVRNGFACIEKKWS